MSAASRMLIQHVARSHPEWLVSREGQHWVDEVNHHADIGWFRTENALEAPVLHPPSCPICGAWEAPPTGTMDPPVAAGSDEDWHGPPPHWLPLLVATWRNDIQQVQILLQDPAIVQQIDNGPGFGDERSALYHAVRYDLADLAILLLQARADPLKHMTWQPRTPRRPRISTTPYHAVDQERQIRLKDAFNAVLFSGPAPPPPPPAKIKVHLSNGTSMWI